MSDLTITHNGVAVTANDAGSSISTGRKKVIRVIPTIETSEYASGDVIFNSVAIPNAVKESGGCSKLLAAYMVTNSTDTLLFEMIFTENAATFGTVNATANISDADIRAAKVLASWASESTDDTTQHLDNSEIRRIFDTRSANGANTGNITPTLIQAAEGSTDVYFAVLGGSTITFGSTTDLEFIFHIEY
tara:strand:+ start:46 stop:615 length:570 start_codon:yes stop_codon:yes gene_type:complete